MQPAAEEVAAFDARTTCVRVYSKIESVVRHLFAERVDHCVPFTVIVTPLQHAARAAACITTTASFISLASCAA
jgi:hypothetical protein